VASKSSGLKALVRLLVNLTWFIPKEILSFFSVFLFFSPLEDIQMSYIYVQVHFVCALLFSFLCFFFVLHFEVIYKLHNIYRKRTDLSLKVKANQFASLNFCFSAIDLVAKVILSVLVNN